MKTVSAVAAALLSIAACGSGTPSPSAGGGGASTSAAGGDPSSRSPSGSPAAGATSPAGTSAHGTAATGGPKLTVAFPAGERAPFANWPDVCTVLSDTELKTVFPGVDGAITRKGTYATILGESAKSPHFVSCKYTIPLSDDAYPSQPTYVTLAWDEIGDPALVGGKYDTRKAAQATTGQKYPDQYKDYGTTLGSEGCYWTGTALFCHQGSFLFDVYGSRSNGGANTKAFRIEFREVDLGNIIETLAARMH